MNNRPELPNELLTINNFFEYTNTIESLLNLETGILSETFSQKTRLHTLEEQLKSILFTHINAYDNSIISATYDEETNKILTEFIDKKRAPLKKSLEQIYLVLDSRRNLYLRNHEKFLDEQFQYLLGYINQVIMHPGDNETTLTTEVTKAREKVIGVLDLINNETDVAVAAFSNTQNLNHLFADIRAEILKVSNEISEFQKGILPKPEPAQISIREKYPVLMRALIGSLIGVAVVATVAITLGIIVATGGAAAAPILAFASLLANSLSVIGAALVTATAGLATIGLGALMGGLVGLRHKKQAEPVSESTSKILKQVHFDKSAKGSEVASPANNADLSTGHVETFTAQARPAIVHSPSLRRK